MPKTVKCIKSRLVRTWIFCSIVYVAMWGSIISHTYKSCFQILMSALRILITVWIMQTVQTPMEALSVSVGLASLVMEEQLEMDVQVLIAIWNTESLDAVTK